MYLGSRIPQIRELQHTPIHPVKPREFNRFIVEKNTETKCEGLSPALFMFTIGGNIFFVLSVCIASMEWRYLLINASWLAGSGLAVFLDFYVSPRPRTCDF